MGMPDTATTSRPEKGSRLGERVRSLRLAAGLTQSDLASDRFSKEYISQIERGKTRPTDATIAWLAEQEWSNGSVGMFGTSYSGFNSLQVAALRPPALQAIIPIYATDRRFTDDVHYGGGAMRGIDFLDYPMLMVAMNALPPVPSVYGEGWREAARRHVGPDDAEGDDEVEEDAKQDRRPSAVVAGASQEREGDALEEPVRRRAAQPGRDDGREAVEDAYRQCAVENRLPDGPGSVEPRREPSSHTSSVARAAPGAKSQLSAAR